MKDERQHQIDTLYSDPVTLKLPSARKVVESVIADLDAGKIRVAEKADTQWVTQEWIKKAILLYFRIRKVSAVKAGDLRFWDKVPLKKWTGKEGVRVVPHALARYGAHIKPGCVMMPSYVNIGAHVETGTMVDTWATVGSCAQVGKNVHLSGGVGIGGVLEPIQATPVIVEDHAFIGSRCIVVEGVIVGEGAVLGAGVVLTKSTKIIDVSADPSSEHRGYIPPYSVVIPGSIPKTFPAGTFHVPCALIIGKRNAKTDQKTSLTEVLRDYAIAT